MIMWGYKQYNDFRRDQNQIAANWFLKKNFAVQQKYPFILKSHNDWKSNIILSAVADFIDKTKNDYEKRKEPFPLHKYIHHGLSSQAMLFNLLGDSVVKKDLDFFSHLFDYADVYIDTDSELLFEYSDRKTFNEKQQQPTSFDFAIKNKNGKNVFVEAKYVETEFGKCSTIDNGDCEGLNPVNNPDLCYLTHKERNYWELMKKHGLDKSYINSPICPFSVYYQFYRELLFAIENNGYYVILTDSRNPAFYKSANNSQRGLIPILINLIPGDLRPIIKMLNIQEVIDKLENLDYDWTEEFRDKYGLKK